MNLEEWKKKNSDTLKRLGVNRSESTGAQDRGETQTVQKQETPSTATEKPQESNFVYKPYTPSQAVLDAQSRLESLVKPGEYKSQWYNQLQQSLDAILGRKDFRYDLNGDALYQQYKEQYQNLGQQAMMDTMGQAAALTGGYGNSYASTAGNQAYQRYLQGLNDKIPELAALARQNYDKDTQAMYDRANLLNAMENQDYGRWSDQYNRWDAERQYLYNIYNNERDYDYSKYSDDRNFQYNQSQDAIAYQQWQAEMAERKRQFDLEYALSQAAQNAVSHGGGSSSRGSSSGSSGTVFQGYKTGNLTGNSAVSEKPSGGGKVGSLTGGDTVAMNDAINKIRAMRNVPGAADSPEYVRAYLINLASTTNLSPEQAAQVMDMYERGKI